MAFAGLVIAILMQREELQLQREELKRTNEEMRLQRFERMFFEMLRLHNEIVNAMRIDFAGERYVDEAGPPELISTPVMGRDCFREFERQLDGCLDRQDLPHEDLGKRSTGLI